ncbi:30S ribosomal S6 [Thalictrum thalictroides]|uniref:30S ribosomal S6 n=1 Tax=Thalictrum thalictroides TaxID=46969 RepID=A0A7J6WNV1_THATH|nr:30S ribosomal S6 [Thalictrum thalictroides]
MEVLNTVSSATCFPSNNNSQRVHKEKLFKTQISCLISANGCSSPCSFSTRKLCVKGKDRKLVIVEAKKKKKSDSHSFVSKPDEATGPFPEAVLLKEKKLQEDGRVLPEFADADEEKLFEFLNLQLESDLNLEQMRHYEVVYLIHEDHKEAVGSVNTKVEEFIKENKGRIWRFSDWGMRRLAYKIKKAKNAHYILMNFELEASLINDFKSMLDKDERVIRHLVIKRDKAITENCPPPPEFHTTRANMDDDEKEDMEDEEYDDDDEGGEDEDDGNMVSYIDNVEDDVVVIDDKENSRPEGSARAITRKRTYA